MAASSPNLNFLQRFNMKITAASRNENNEIIFVLEDGTSVHPSAEYIADKKPQIGDDYEVETQPTE